jgi:hypothetical protein
MLSLWNINNKETEASDKHKTFFNNLLIVAKKLPPVALSDLIMAIIPPLQSDLLLAVAEEGKYPRPVMTPREFFFDGIFQGQDHEEMINHTLNPNDHPLFLATDMLLPCRWSMSLYIENLSHIGAIKGFPWQQDYCNHSVDLWLPWKIGFIHGGNHSITAGILAGEGTLIPEHVYDMSYLFQIIKTDGAFWYVNGYKAETVKSWRSAAIFEIGRLMNLDHYR